jgi:hypothetical protein
MAYDHRSEGRFDTPGPDIEERRRREDPPGFDREFAAWLDRRGRQREALNRTEERMEVVGCDGAHVGTVDGTRGDHIVLARNDEKTGGVHHAIPSGWIEAVTDKVVLNLAANQARKRWRVEGRSRALFKQDSGSPGPGILNRSFSGTYSDKE